MTAPRYTPGEAAILAPPRSAADLEREEARAPAAQQAPALPAALRSQVARIAAVLAHNAPSRPDPEAAQQAPAPSLDSPEAVREAAQRVARDTLTIDAAMVEGETYKHSVRGVYEHKGVHFTLYLPPGSQLPLGYVRITIERTAPGFRSALSTAPQREAVPVLTKEERGAIHQQASDWGAVAAEARGGGNGAKANVAEQNRAVLLAIIDRLSTAPLPVVQGGEDPDRDMDAILARRYAEARKRPIAPVPSEGLTPADRLSLIADLVSGLPHGPGTPGPGLELGESAEAYALLSEMSVGRDSNYFERDRYTCVRINGLWIGASKPKTEGK